MDMKPATAVKAKTRDAAVDFVRGVCIILVVFGHVPRFGTTADEITSFISWCYQFHVPIFVLLGGWFSYGKMGERKDFISLLKQLVIPYYGGTLVLLGGYFIASLVGAETTSNPVVEFGLFKAILKWLTGDGMGATWFIAALAMSKGAFLLSGLCARKCNIANPVWIACACLFLYVNLRTSLLYGYGPGLSLWFPVWFAIGYVSRSVMGTLPKMPLTGLVMVALSFTIGSSQREICNFLIVVGMFLALYGIGSLICKCRSNLGVCFCGRNSLAILIFHPVVTVVLRPLQKFLVGRMDSTGILSHLMVTAIAVLVSIAIDKVLASNRVTKPLLHP